MLNKAIRTVRETEPLRRQPRPSRLRGDPYLTDLVERLFHDGDPWMWSSYERISHKAGEEAQYLNDPALVAKLAEILEQKLDKKRLGAVVSI